jgi:two-component system chemotaxis response regulator CheB
MRVAKRGPGYYVRVTKEEKISGHCPSVDVLFRSVAEVVKDKAIGVIMTGMGKDGADGLLKMRKSGAYTIGQDEKSSVVYGMPMVAFNIGAVQKQLPLERIPDEIIRSLAK